MAIDGGRVRVRAVIRTQEGSGRHEARRRRYRVGWREPKLVIISELDAQGRMARGSRPWIDGTFGGPDEAMERLALHRHHPGAAEAEMVVSLADGAPGIWGRLDWVIRRVGRERRRVAEVLDSCHAVHQISLALEALDPDAGERERRLKVLRRWLRAGQAWELIAESAVLARGQPPAAAVWTPIAYLEEHAAAGHLGYRKYRRSGLPSGSGAIESAIRRVVNSRLKGNGIPWAAANAEGMPVMRAAALTERWEETVKQVREGMATDRRLDWAWKSPDMPAALQAPATIGPPLPRDRQSQHPNKVPA